MQILDVFSWLPKKEIDIDELKTIFLKSFLLNGKIAAGLMIGGYLYVLVIPL